MAPARPAHEGHVQPALERAQPRPPQAASCHLTPPALAAPPAAFVTAPLEVPRHRRGAAAMSTMRPETKRSFPPPRRRDSPLVFTDLIAGQACTQRSSRSLLVAGPAIGLSFRVRTLETRRLETLAGSHAVRAEPALPALALPARGVPEFRACKRCRATLGPVEARAVGTEPRGGSLGPRGRASGKPGPACRAAARAPRPAAPSAHCRVRASLTRPRARGA